jgi:hypothetical protein
MPKPGRFLAAASLAALLAAGCGNRQEANAAAPVVNAPQPKAEPTPEEVARNLVTQRLGGAPVQFGPAQVFTNGGATVVCGRYQASGQAPNRYIAIGREDVFIEGEFSGDMNQAVAETCRNG